MAWSTHLYMLILRANNAEARESLIPCHPPTVKSLEDDCIAADLYRLLEFGATLRTNPDLQITSILRLVDPSTTKVQRILALF